MKKSLLILPLYLLSLIACSSNKEHVHDFKTQVIDATCINQGSITYTCKKCSYSYSELTQKSGHHYGEYIVIKEASCTKDGIKSRTCSICQESEVVSIPSSGAHKYTSVVTMPTCIEQGYTTKTCSVCNFSGKTDYVNPLGHNYSSWEISKVATSSSQGTKTRTCSRCNKKESASYKYVNPNNYLTLSLSNSNVSLSSEHSDGNYEKLNVDNKYFFSYRGTYYSSGVGKLLSGDISTINVPEQPLKGSFSNYVPIKGIKKISLSYQTSSNATLRYGYSNLVDKEFVIPSSSSSYTFNINEEDISYFKIETGSSNLTIKTLDITYSNEALSENASYLSSGESLYRINPIVSDNNYEGKVMSLPILSTCSSDGCVISQYKDYTYYSYDYLKAHPSLASDNSYTDPIDVANYFTAFGTYPSNYVEKVNYSSARNIFSSKTRCVFEYSGSGGYASSVPARNNSELGKPIYYECDISLDGYYSSSNRGVGRLVVFKDGLTTYSVSSPTAFFTDDHYATFIEYLNNGNWSHRFNSISSSSIGMTTTCKYNYGASKTISIK